MTKKLFILLIVGVSGVGKTTLSLKLAENLTKKNKKVVLVDTLEVKDSLLKILKKEKKYKSKLEKLNLVELSNIFSEDYSNLHKKAWELIVKEFNSMDLDTVIILGHLLVKRKNGYKEIFTKKIINLISPNFIVFLTSSPNRIISRRRKESSRKFIEEGFFSSKSVKEEIKMEKNIFDSFKKYNKRIIINNHLKRTINKILEVIS